MSELLIIWIMSVRLSLFALCLIERHRSQNEGSLKSKERLSDFKERFAQLCKHHRVLTLRCCKLPRDLIQRCFKHRCFRKLPEARSCRNG